MDPHAHSRPHTVHNAILLFVIALALGVIRGLLIYSEHPELALTPATMGAALILGISIAFLFLYKIWQGKNWARMTFFIFFLIGLPFAIISLAQPDSNHIAARLCGIFQVLLQAAAFFLLFQKPSNQWFKNLK